MPKHILGNVRTFSGGADLTSQSNKVELSLEFDDKDVTTFADVDAGGDVWKAVLGGVGSAKVAAAGFWSAGDPSQVDDDAWAALGGVGALTIYPYDGGAAAGNVAWIVNALRAQYQLLGSVGDAAPWALAASSTWPGVRGIGLHPPGTARAASGVGPAQLHVAAAAGQMVYASLHVLSITGTAAPTLTVKVQSDDAVGFATPTDRIVFAPATARGGQVARLAGPITDTYWRVSWDITGTTPSCLFVAAVGVK